MQDGPFQPTVVIAAEIAFAGLLLYLANQPLNLGDLTQASKQISQPGQISQTGNSRAEALSLNTLEDFNHAVPRVKLAASIIDAADRPLVK